MGPQAAYIRPLSMPTPLGVAYSTALGSAAAPTSYTPRALVTVTLGSTVAYSPPSTNGPGWLLTTLGSTVAPPRRSSIHGRAPAGLNLTTKLRLTTPSVFPTSSRTLPPFLLTHYPASPAQLSRPRVCAPHRRMLDVSVPVQEPRERSR